MVSKIPLFLATACAKKWWIWVIPDVRFTFEANMGHTASVRV